MMKLTVHLIIEGRSKPTHGPHELRVEVDQGIDYCPECVEIEVAKHKHRFPEHTSEIFADGGYEPLRFADSPATCERCNCMLSCSIDVDGDSFYIETEADWCAAP